MQELIAASGLPQGAVASPVFGPAGMLRQRLMAGEPADLFAFGRSGAGARGG
jgi:molybdate transport system substrate-binding protein